MTKRLWFSVTAKDCEWTYFNPAGGGGQHKNKNQCGARCHHRPSGAMGQAGDSKSLKQNKRNAFERMSQSKEFQAWLNFKIEAGKGNLKIQEGEAQPRSLSKEEV